MTTKIYSFISFLCLLFIVSACQKEFTFEDGSTGGTTTGTAVFKFVGSPGNCSSPTINGIFQAGIVLDTSNKLSVQVDVTTIGTFIISSNSNNGINFSSSGTFTVTGLQTIIFKAAGTPAAGGSFDFTFGTGSCTFSVTCSAGASNNNDCKDCIYVPFCVGSKYEYSDTIADPIFGNDTNYIRHADYLSAVDTTFDGRAYKKMGISDGTATAYSYVNCLNGETRVVAYNIQSSTTGNILLAVKSIELKANAPVGTTWTDTTVYASGNILYRKHTISQKGITRNVLGINYNDVIKVTVDQSIFYVDPPLGLNPAGVAEYYLAKGIGLIETITYGENPLTNDTYVAYHSVLKTFIIP